MWPSWMHGFCNNVYEYLIDAAQEGWPDVSCDFTAIVSFGCAKKRENPGEKSKQMETRHILGAERRSGRWFVRIFSPITFPRDCAIVPG